MNRTLLFLTLGLVLFAAPVFAKKTTCRSACKPAIAKCVHACLQNTHGIPHAGHGCRVGCRITDLNACKLGGVQACIDLANGN